MLSEGTASRVHEPGKEEKVKMTVLGIREGTAREGFALQVSLSQCASMRYILVHYDNPAGGGLLYFTCCYKRKLHSVQ